MKKITQRELTQWINQGQVIERDGKGVKVVLYDNGEFLKIFHRSSGISWSRLIPRSKQFALNAHQLLKRNIPTVEIMDCFLVRGEARDAVRYRGLDGDTLRKALVNKPHDKQLSCLAGAFIANLHDAGVLFRSLHFGNIILQPNGDLGLIDIADMKVMSYSLNRWQRKRNFKHVFRYAKDMMSIDREAFIGAYTETTLKPISGEQIQELFDTTVPAIDR